MSSAGQLSTDSRQARSPVEIWGLTGGVASGKSTAAAFFEKAGIIVVDADKIAHQLTEPDGNAYPAIMRRFGTADRAKLREIVFSDPAAKRDLEAILHPLIQTESIHRVQLLAQAKFPNGTESGKPLHVIYEAALLVETERYKNLAGLIVVDCPAEIRRKRLVTRDGLSPEMADKILQAQASDSERRAAATVLFDNSKTLDDLRKQVMEFITRQGWAQTGHKTHHEVPPPSQTR